MADTLTTFTNVLKEYYPAGGIVTQLNVDTFLLDKVEKPKNFTMIGGRYFYKTIRTGLSGGSSPAAEGGTLPTPGNFGYQPIQIKQAYSYGVIQLTGPLMNMSKG